MQRTTDIRAVENPISATFDLAADVYKRAPKVKKLVTYCRAFIYLWLLLGFIVIVAVSAYPGLTFLLLLIVSLTLYCLRWADNKQTRLLLMALGGVLSFFVALFSGPPLFLLEVLLLVLYALGWIILDLLRDLRKFFDYYVVRHGVIKAVRDANPEVRIPEGPDPVSRLLAYLRKASPENEHVLSQPGAVKRPVQLRGASGVAHDFDAMVLAEPSSLWSLTGWAYPGWVIFIKKYEAPPKLEDLKYLKHAAEDSLAVLKVPLSRVIALWSMKEGLTVSDDAYQFATGQVVIFRRHGDVFLCSLEMIAENEDGTYDLVPYVVQTPT